MCVVVCPAVVVVALFSTRSRWVLNRKPSRSTGSTHFNVTASPCLTVPSAIIRSRTLLHASVGTSFSWTPAGTEQRRVTQTTSSSSSNYNYNYNYWPVSVAVRCSEQLPAPRLQVSSTRLGPATLPDPVTADSTLIGPRQTPPASVRTLRLRIVTLLYWRSTFLSLLQMISKVFSKQKQKTWRFEAMFLASGRVCLSVMWSIEHAHLRWRFIYLFKVIHTLHLYVLVPKLRFYWNIIE